MVKLAQVTLKLHSETNGTDGFQLIVATLYKKAWTIQLCNCEVTILALILYYRLFSS